MTQDVAGAGLDELLTYYDDATGERVGLTAGELGTWSAATAALLGRGCGLGAGSQAAVLLPPHWQTAVVLLGCWATGVEVSFRGWSTAGLTPAGSPLDVSFVEERRIGSWLDDVPSAGYQFSLPLSRSSAASVSPGSPPAGSSSPRPPAPGFPAAGSPAAGSPPPSSPPAGYDDFIAAVTPWLGAALPPGTVDPGGRVTVTGETYGEYARIAAEIAELRRIGPGDRVLVDSAASEQPLIWLLAPLSVGASIVLCANFDRTRMDRRVAEERVTRVLG